MKKDFNKPALYFSSILLLIAFLPSFLHSQSTGFAMGYNGTFFRTTNSGVNWTSQSVGTNQTLWCPWFVNPGTGWIAGGSSNNSIILKTTSGGESWFEQPSNVNHWLTCVYFINSQTGWMAGAGHTILKTTNAGTNWIILTTEQTNLLIESIWFADEYTGWITGWSGNIFKTTDGGSSWFSQKSGTISNLYTSKFFSNSTGYIAGGGGTILKTIDGGMRWRRLTTGINSEIFSIVFTDTSTGYASGNSGLILKTTNAGMNWIQISYGTSIRLECINFINSMTGWIVGGFGGNIILKTTNAGTNWISQPTGSTQYLYSVIFPQTPLGIEHVTGEVPCDFKLYQNYPNPFNPSTQIKFDYSPQPGVQKYDKVVLKIYDASGREVQTLINESLKSGTCEVIFDGAYLNSGVYFYKITAGDFTETKKMVLLK